MTSYSIFNLDTVKCRITSPGMKFKIPGAMRSLYVNPEGECLNESQYRVEIKGAHGSHSIYISSPDSGKSLVIEGSLAGFLYGQNVYTSPKLLPLIIQCLKRVCEQLAWKPTREQIKSWKRGDGIVLERVDLAVNFRLDSDLQVNSALMQIKRQAIEHNFGIEGHGTTVYFKPDSGRNRSIAFYGKYAEMRHSRRFDGLSHKQRLVSECEGLLRVEVHLHEAELADMGLRNASEWDDKSARMAFVKPFKKFKFLEITSGPVTEKELAELPSRLWSALVIHKLGGDMELAFEERTLQRRRADFRKLGIDLKCPNEPVGEVLNITKLLSESKAVTAPDWLVEAGLAPDPDPDPDPEQSK